MKKLNDVIKEQRIIVFDSEITKSSMEKKRKSSSHTFVKIWKNLFDL